VRRIITIKDVARSTGVSISTVSKALNGHPGMSADTRKKVLTAAEKIGFRRNDLAHALHRGTSRTIGIISSDNFGRFTIPIAAGLEERLGADQISVFLCNATEDPALERKHIAQLLAKRVDALVFTARRLDKRPAPIAEELGVPHVFAFSQGGAGAISIIPDDEQGARLAVEHLVSCGASRIAHISGPERFEAVAQRRAGYEKAIAARGLAFMATRNGPWSEQSGYRLAQELFSSGGAKPDALFCGSDQLARGALDHLREAGISVPGQVQVIGFDNWDVMTEGARPKLTSIDMNLRRLGHASGETLIELLNGGRVSGTQRLPCTLIQRASTRQP
jgi:LacI family transcriptional regulator